MLFTIKIGQKYELVQLGGNIQKRGNDKKDHIFLKTVLVCLKAVFPGAKLQEINCKKE